MATFMKPGVPPELFPKTGPALPPHDSPTAVAARLQLTVTRFCSSPPGLATAVSELWLKVTTNCHDRGALSGPR